MNILRGSAVAVMAALATLVVAAIPAVASGGQPMRILTYPTGLVTGELEVKVDLGTDELPARLHLDGESACSLTGTDSSCNVDLGPDPHVHLLELVRKDGARAGRWVNRPGQEAELSLIPLPASGSQWCEARISWHHPERLAPVELEVTLAGTLPEISDGGRPVRCGLVVAARPYRQVSICIRPHRGVNLLLKSAGRSRLSRWEPARLGRLRTYRICLEISTMKAAEDLDSLRRMPCPRVQERLFLLRPLPRSLQLLS